MDEREQNTNPDLVDNSARETAHYVTNEEEAGDPGALEQINLDGVSRSGAVHHLGYGDAGEGQPAPHSGGTEGNTDG